MKTALSPQLQKRVLSALLLAPAVLALIYAGGYPFLIFLGMVCVLGLLEWYGLAEKTTRPVFFMLLGGIYILVSFAAFYLIQSGFHFSMAVLFVALLWASDIGAYFTGKAIGGPKMATQISPNKTWAGMGGAIFAPALILLAYFLVTHDFDAEMDVLVLLLVAGGVIGFVGQVGDLLMSWMKRRAGVKDSGKLIPGHGGLLDRIDSLMLAAPVYLYVITYFSGLFVS